MWKNYPSEIYQSTKFVKSKSPYRMVLEMNIEMNLGKCGKYYFVPAYNTK